MALSGVRGFKERIRAVRDKWPDRFAEAMGVEGEIEVTEIKRRTPVDRGPLRASVHGEGPFREGRRIWYKIVAGGPSAPYAIFVHEDLEAFHPVGQAKFIESVVLESRAYFLQRVARRAELRRGV